MTISNFDKRLQVEQLRHIEEMRAFTCNEQDLAHELSKYKGFDDRLWQRSQCLVKRYDLSVSLGHAAKLTCYARSIAIILAAVLGVLGILYAINDSQRVNIYWLLLVLLGFNSVSMLLWLIGISLNMKSLVAGALARLTSWIPAWFSAHFKHTHNKISNIEDSDLKNSNLKDSAKKNSDKENVERENTESIQLNTKAADKAWLSSHYSGAIGKWQLSKITHQLWLVYLLTGLLFLVLLLMVRQYDFIWGTTLLPDTAFINLTQKLSVPLQALGFSTPSVELIQATRTGATQILTEQHRHSWALFLLGTLLCFGVAPRLLLLAWSTLMCSWARRRFTLDYYLPYYISLRQQLMPLASHGQIVDADTQPPVISETPALTPTPHTLPLETVWVAVELGTDINWLPESVATEKNLGHITDRASLSRVLNHLQGNSTPVIAVTVAAARPPDRGVQRIINQLMSEGVQRWLVLLQNNPDEKILETRLAAWYRLAEACDVPAEHVICMRMP